MTSARPNILLITSDQQRADCIGCENRHLRTPHLDQLAREGTRFSANITPNLVCQPSRASILTGLLPLTHGGNHGLYLKHPIPYEDLLRVTLIARGPGVAAAQVVAEPVSTLDLAPTFYECAGVVAPEGLQGRSLRRLLGGEPETRDVAYSEWHVHPSRCGVGLQLRTVRTRTLKCTFDLASDAGELYDLASDPAEMDNRYDDPAYAKVKRELRDMMRARPGAVRSDLAEPVGMA